VLVAKARPTSFPEIIKKVDVTVESVTVTTGLPEVQAKAYLCDDTKEICE
jgi:hypothetical protein